MKTFTFNEIPRQYKNNGQHLESCIRAMFNQSTKADNRKGGADIVINGIGYQIKGMRSTLCHGENIENIRTEYATADGFIFGDIETLTAYILTFDEFIKFASEFAEIARESKSNGGAVKMRLNRHFAEQRARLQGLAQ